MGRRSDHSRDELYELALNAARQIVEADGFRALTARNVADAIGYSPGTLYNLFENLDELVVHLNGRTLDELYDQLSGGPKTGVPEDDAGRLVAEYLSFLEQNPRLWNVLFEHKLPEGETLPEWYDVKVDKVLGRVEDALSPLFTPDDAEGKQHAARVLWASLHGICSLSETGKLDVVTPRPVRDMAVTLVKNFVTGLRVNVAEEKNRG
ncbi:MAG: TetR/AcrR family transcriptional regulator [Rhodospirillales bacterium]|nr:TetR/AcrR family transcriptional regulator [Rhodospirillales bacterium]